MLKKRIIVSAVLGGMVAVATAKALHSKIKSRKVDFPISDNVKKQKIVGYVLDKKIEQEDENYNRFQELTIHSNNVEELYELLEALSDEELSKSIKFELDGGRLVIADIIVYLERESNDEQHFAQIDEFEDDELVKVFIYKD